MRLHLDKRSFTILTFLKVVVCIKLKLGEAVAFKGFQGATSSSRLSRYDRKNPMSSGTVHVMRTVCMTTCSLMGQARLCRQVSFKADVSKV